jgi:hypothetical protein
MSTKLKFTTLISILKIKEWLLLVNVKYVCKAIEKYWGISVGISTVLIVGKITCIRD